MEEPTVESISAVTLGSHDVARGERFYQAMGMPIAWRSGDGTFTVFRAGAGYLNLVLAAPDAQWGWWGRIVIYVSDVDAQYRRALDAGYSPQFEPRDAPWGERYFHLNDPDGHELSFAKRLAPPTR